MQSGKARADEWVLEYEREDRQRHDPLTGWVGSADTKRQVRLRFESEAAAVSYAQKSGLDYVVEPPRVHRLKIQAYSDNFR